MSDPERSAFPDAVAVGATGDVYTGNEQGLTVREYAAIQIMAGIMQSWEGHHDSDTARVAVDRCMAFTDALLARLVAK